jgi:hypothetical protein
VASSRASSEFSTRPIVLVEHVAHGYELAHGRDALLVDDAHAAGYAAAAVKSQGGSPFWGRDKPACDVRADIGIMLLARASSMVAGCEVQALVTFRFGGERFFLFDGR